MRHPEFRNALCNPVVASTPDIILSTVNQSTEGTRTIYSIAIIAVVYMLYVISA